MRNNLTNTSVAMDSAGIIGVPVYTSSAQLITGCFGYSIHAAFARTSGAIAGSIKTQKSNNGVYWVDETTTNLVDGVTGHIEFEKADAMYAWVRYVITVSNGTGVFSVLAHVKGI